MDVIRPLCPDIRRESNPTAAQIAEFHKFLQRVRALPPPVKLESVKAAGRFAKMALVANSRLSVQPATDEEWRIVCAMGGLRSGSRSAPLASLTLC